MAISPTLFATVFGVIFLAELPDKTALAALLLATRHRPLPVFLGASLALTVQSVIAVATGSLLARLPSQPVHRASGLFFIGCAVLMWLRQRHDKAEQRRSERPASRRNTTPGSPSFWRRVSRSGRWPRSPFLWATVQGHS